MFQISKRALIVKMFPLPWTNKFCLIVLETVIPDVQSDVLHMMLSTIRNRYGFTLIVWLGYKVTGQTVSCDSGRSAGVRRYVSEALSDA